MLRGVALRALMTLSLAGGAVGLAAPAAHASTPSADLVVALYPSGDTAALGAAVHVTAYVSDQGPDDADAVEVHLTVPSTAVASNVTPSQGTCAVDLTCSLGAVGVAGGGVTVDFDVTFAVAGRNHVGATIPQGAAWTDPRSSNNTADAVVTVGGPAATHWSAPSIRAVGASAPYVEVKARLSYHDDGEPVSGPVTLMRRAAGSSGSFATVAGGYTDSTGLAVVDDYSPQPGKEYLLRFGGDPLSKKADSAVVAVQQQAAGVTVTSPAVVTYRSGFTYKAKAVVEATGKAVAFASARLQRKLIGGVWKTYSTTQTDLTGVAAFPVAAPRNGYYRVSLGATLRTPAMTTTRRFVGVRPRLSQGLSPVMIPKGGTSVLSFHLAGVAPGAAVEVQRYAGGVWTTVATRRLDSALRATYTTRPWKLGTYAYRVRKPGSAASAFETLTGARQTVSVVAAGPGRPGMHAFMNVFDGKPVRWNPCRSIGYRVNWTYAPAGARADLAEALRRVTLATGIRFSLLGTTSYLPRSDGKGQPAEVVIGWSPRDPEAPTQSWRNSWVAGVGGATYIYGTNLPIHYYQGMVALNSWQHLTPGFGRGQTEGSLLLHEIGHLMGLNHVFAESQIMYPSLHDDAKAAIYGAGDIAGLQQLGRSQGCI